MAYRLTLAVITVLFMQKSCTATSSSIIELSSSMSESSSMTMPESSTATPAVAPTTSTASSGSTSAGGGGGAGASTSITESTSVTESITPSPTQSTSQVVSASASYGVYTAWNVTCKEAGCCDETNVGLTPKQYTQHRQCNPGNCRSDGFNMTKSTSCPQKTTDCALCSSGNGAGSVEPIFFPMALSLIMMLFTYIFA